MKGEIGNLREFELVYVNFKGELGHLINLRKMSDVLGKLKILVQSGDIYCDRVNKN